MGLFNEQELITKSAFHTKGGRTAASILAESAREVDEDEQFDLFLSHSRADARYILALSKRLERDGHSVYVDWEVDPQLDRSKVDKKTARLLRKRMQNCTALIYAFTQNSGKSIWMPWELGYFDGMSDLAAVLPIMPQPRSRDVYKGAEYLGLYPYISRGHNADGEPELWVNRAEDRYVSLTDWLAGSKPSQH